MSRKKSKKIEEIYQKKSPREHVLLRPDTYVGSVERDTQKVFVVDPTTNTMKEEEIEFVPALYKIFDEILVNAADNKQRDESMKEIRVTINKNVGCIIVRNDGKGIPIEIHKEHDMYVPELIFGNLLTSSNYDDTDLKTVGGRNGFGAKLANIFSTKFIVETVDSSKCLKYKQKWTKNMAKKGEPEISDVSRKTKDYTKISFYPDFSRFGMESFDGDIIKLFIKRVYDIAGTTPKDLKVYLTIKDDKDDCNENETKLIHMRSFIDYAKMYIGSAAKSRTDYFHCVIGDELQWEVILSVNHDNEYRQISHVNNIWTIKGGTHVKYIENQFIKYFKENFKDKTKAIKDALKPKMIRDHLFIFVKALIVNPAFSSQTKEILTTKSSQFGTRCVIPTDINKRLMTKIKEMVKELINFKLEKSLKKTDGRKKSKIDLPPEVDDAFDAGSKYSDQCTLIVTEGLSAKTLAVAGVSELPGGKRRFGIFPLKGKLLNVRDASASSINKNNEIANLKKALGLQHKAKYNDDKNYKKLRYGKVMIMTDQDYDGSHIKGLMINFFHSLWPELVQSQDFLQQFITPIVVAKKGKKMISFYTIPEYEQWKLENNNGKGWKVKYYKGLGTWKRKDGKEHFRQLAKHKIDFKYNLNDGNNGKDNDLAIIKAFSKDKSDLRKEWISDYREGTYLDFTKKSVSYKEFVDRELILFSVNDLNRSIPSIYDGLKPGQRKILYCCFLKGKFKTEIRVAQLGGYVSEKSAYHHGEMSLYQTIIGMAQDFVGSNNINLLQPNGMFGSRLKGGKDAASPRYIHTNLAPVTRYIYKNDDDLILKYQDDDGYPVEPKYYLPIIPMVLVNGAEGIGTGWSTFIPNFNPNDIIKNIRKKLSGEDWFEMSPYYRGWNGKMIQQQTDLSLSTPKTYKSYANVEIIDTRHDNENVKYSTLQITELPIRVWTDVYKKLLMDLEDTDQVENVNNMSSDIDVAFTFDIPHRIKQKNGRGKKAKSNDSSNSNSREHSHSPTSSKKETKKIKKKVYFNGNLDDDFLRTMKLSSSITCSNMVLFDTNNKIKKYYHVNEILDEFYGERLKQYTIRKNALLSNMNHQLMKITNQARFIMMIIDEQLIIRKKPRLQIVKELKAENFEPWKEKTNANSLESRRKKTTVNDDDDEEGQSKLDEDGDVNINGIDDETEILKILSSGYDYLLKMPLYSLTKEKVDDLLQKQEDTRNEVKILQQKSSKDLWRNDLDELEKYLNFYHNEHEENLKEMRRQTKKSRDKTSLTKGGKTKKRKTTKNTKSKKVTKTTKTTKTTKAKSKSKSSSVKTVQSNLEKFVIDSKKEKTTKIKKKKLNSSNTLPRDPFSIAKNAKKKQLKTKSKIISDDDDEDETSPAPTLSFSQRAKLKQKKTAKQSRKRKREMMDTDDDDDDDEDLFEDSEIEIDEYQPPKKKRNTKSSSLNLSDESDGINRNAKKRKKTLKKIIDSDDSEYDDDDDEEEEEEYYPAKKNKNKNKRKTNKKNKIDDSDEDFDIDDDDDDYSDSNDDESENLNNHNKNKRTLRRTLNKKSYKDKSTSPESYESDLEVDENIDSDSEYIP